MAEEKINIVIKGNSVSARTALSKIDSSLKKTGETTKKTSASFAKLKTVGKIALAALVGAMVIIGKKSVDAASNLEEVSSKFATVFGPSQIKQADTWAKALVRSYGMSTREARENLAAMQDLFVPMGLVADKAAVLSNEVVKLSADLGSFNNMPTAKVMADIQSALVGNFETMKKYGVVLNATTVQQKAINLGLAGTTGELTAAAKAQAAYKLILEGTEAAQGDMIRTQDSFANQVKFMKSAFEDLQAVIGKELIKAIRPVVLAITEFTRSKEGIEAIKNAVRGIVTGFVILGAVVRTVQNVIEILVQEIIFAIKTTIGFWKVVFKLGKEGIKGFVEDTKEGFAKLVEDTKKDAGDIADTWKGTAELLKEVWTDTGTAFEESLNVQMTAQQQMDAAMRAGIIKNSAFARSMMNKNFIVAKRIAAAEAKAIKKSEALKKRAIAETNKVKLAVMQAGLSAVIDAASDEMATAGTVAKALITSMADALSNIMKMRALAALAIGNVAAASVFGLAAIAIKGIGTKIGAAIAGESVKPIKLADGGIIDEPVRGVGLRTGRSFLMGEAGDERATKITPEDSEAGNGIMINTLIIQALDFEDVQDKFLELHRLTNSQAVPR